LPKRRPASIIPTLGPPRLTQIDAPFSSRLSRDKQADQQSEQGQTGRHQHRL
jgi:hypothetical protein